METLPDLKEIAQDFLRLAARGNSREAFRLYTGDTFQHHNPYFKGDGNSLMLAMEENAVINPNKTFDIQRALQDGDLVAVHSRVQLEKQDTVLAVVHIFRFEKGKIVELWDIGMAEPKEIANENGLF